MVLKVAAAAAQFADFMAGQGLAPATVRRQLGSIRGRGGFVESSQKLKGPGVTMGQLDHQCVASYFAAHTGVVGSRNQKLIAVRKFLEWAEMRKLLRPGFTAKDLLTGQKHKRPTRRPKIYVPPERFGEMLDIAGRHHPRDRAAVALILYTLERQSEMKAERLRDLDLVAGNIAIYREKRDRWTHTAVGPDLRDEMERWLDAYSSLKCYASPGLLTATRPDWLLVPTGYHGGENWRYLATGTPIGQPEHIMQMVLSQMGYPEDELKGEGCHTVRRSGARALFDHLRDDLGFDGALLSTAAMLDHEDPQETLGYIGRDHLRDEMNNWLSSNRMYGTPAQAPEPGANVIPIRPAAHAPVRPAAGRTKLRARGA